MPVTRQSEGLPYHDRPDAFIQKYGEEFAAVPPYMRERVAYLIDQKVEIQVKEQMDDFKSEVWAELKDQRETSQTLITEHQVAIDRKNIEIQRRHFEETKQKQLEIYEEEQRKYNEQHQRYMEHQRKLDEQHKRYLDQQQKFYEEQQRFLSMQTYSTKPITI